MDEYYSGIVWNIDAVLFGLSVFLAISVILYLILNWPIKEKRRFRLLSLVSDLQALAHIDKGLMVKGCVELIKKTTLLEFFDIAKGRKKILPAGFSKQFDVCLADSGKVIEVEKSARKSRNKWRRIEAIIMLGFLNSPRSLEILSRSIDSRDEDIAYFSILSLGHIKSLESAKVLLRAIKDHKASGYKIASMLEDFPPLIVEELIKTLDGQDELLRLWALRLLSRFKPRQYLGKFLRLTAADNSAEIRANACECLGEIAEGQAKDAVAGCLKDDAWFVRLKAVRALEKITGAKSTARIACLIIDENWFVREAVKEIMAAHIEESIPFIEEIFLSDKKKAGQSCLEVLERSGYDKKILEEIFSPSRDIKDKAMRLLAGMIKAGGHLGLEAYLITCGEERRNKITGIIASIDKQRAEHIDKIIKEMIVEF